MADDEEKKLEHDFTELHEVEDKIRAINDELEDEMVKLDKEYSRRKQPLYDQRSKICAKIPNFWLNALLNHPNLQDYISSEDYELLRFLTSVDVKDIDDPASTGTRYTFTFKKNPFFDHTELHKEFKYSKVSGDLEVDSSAIKWKEGKDPTKVKKDSKAKVGEKRGTGGDEDDDEDPDEGSSFFVWFDEEDTQESPIGEWIREDIWKDPFKYFCGPEEDEDDEEGSEYGSDSEDEAEDALDRGDEEDDDEA